MILRFCCLWRMFPSHVTLSCSRKRSRTNFNTENRIALNFQRLKVSGPSWLGSEQRRPTRSLLARLHVACCRSCWRASFCWISTSCTRTARWWSRTSRPWWTRVTRCLTARPDSTNPQLEEPGKFIICWLLYQWRIYIDNFRMPSSMSRPNFLHFYSVFRKYG